MWLLRMHSRALSIYGWLQSSSGNYARRIIYLDGTCHCLERLSQALLLCASILTPSTLV